MYMTLTIFIDHLFTDRLLDLLIYNLTGQVFIYNLNSNTTKNHARRNCNIRYRYFFKEFK
jgi:hypothetical protein